MNDDELTAIETRLRLITGEHWRRMHENQIEAVLPQPDGADRTPLVAAANFVYNADFIAHAPDDVRALIAENQALKAEHRKLVSDLLDTFHEEIERYEAPPTRGRGTRQDFLNFCHDVHAWLQNTLWQIDGVRSDDPQFADAARPAPAGGESEDKGVE